jgi:hypothetical protein
MAKMLFMLTVRIQLMKKIAPWAKPDFGHTIHCFELVG